MIMCKFMQGLIGKKERTCCGGRKRMIEIYSCSMKGEVTYNDCRKCRDYQLPTTKDSELASQFDKRGYRR
jgi:hypothetical protein